MARKNQSEPRRWAIYARKSTDEQLASTETQIREARAAIERRGGIVADEHVYIDDAKSRAEFKNRPALWKMMAAASASEFDALIVRDETRLGGDMHRTGLLMQDLLEAGVRLFFYSSGEEVLLDNPTQKLIATIKNYGSEIERERVSSRVYEHLKGKAERRCNAGGAVFGYTNVPVLGVGPDGRPVRVRTTYEVNEAEAAVVLRMFEMYSAGLGLRKIARALNADGVSSPRAGRRGTGSWSPSTVRSILINDRYRGFVPWNRTQKTYRGGTKVRVERDREEWMLVPAPELRVVSDELFAAAAVKRPGRALASGGKRVGRPPQFLLSGLLRCGQCAGSVQVVHSKDGKKKIRAYACSYHRNRGPEACSNGRRRPMSAVDDAVTKFLIDELEHHGLLEELMAVVERRLVARFTKPSRRDRVALEAEAAQLRAEIARLTDALTVAGSAAEPVLEAIRQRQAKLSAMVAELAEMPVADGAKVISLELKRAKREAREQLAALSERMRADTLAARDVVGALFPDGIRAFPEDDEEGRPRWRLDGMAVFGPATLVDRGVTNVASPGGFEPPLAA